MGDVLILIAYAVPVLVVIACWYIDVRRLRRAYGQQLEAQRTVYERALSDQRDGWTATGQSLFAMVNLWRELGRCVDRRRAHELKRELDAMAAEVERAVDSARSRSGVHLRDGAKAAANG